MANKIRDLAPAVTRAIQLLDVLASSRQPMKQAELTTLLNIPKSSVHGLCSSLIAGGLIERRDGVVYVIGPKVIDLANARLGQNDLSQEFLRIWSEHPEFSDEAAVISELDGTDVVYLACRNSRQALGVTFRVGMKLPAAFAGTGKAILGALSDKEIDRLYSHKRSLTPLTSRGVKSLTALRNQLAEVRKNGYAIDNGEIRDEMVSISAPILAKSTTLQLVPVAGVAVVFFRSQLTDRRKNQAIAAIVEVAETLSLKAGSMSLHR